MPHETAHPGEELIRIDRQLRDGQRGTFGYAAAMGGGLVGTMIGVVVAAASTPPRPLVWFVAAGMAIVMVLGTVGLVVRVRRTRRLCRRVLEILEWATDQAALELPVAVGETIGNMMILEHAPGEMHGVLAMGAHRGVMARNAVLLVASVAMGVLVVGQIVLSANGLAGGQGSRSVDVIQAILMGFGSVALLRFAMRSSPVQWIASRQSATFQIERVHRAFLRDVIEIPAGNIKGFEMDADSLRVVRIDGAAEPLVRLASMLEFLQSVFHPGVARSRDRVGNGAIRLREWQARRLTRAIGTTLGIQPLKFRNADADGSAASIETVEATVTKEL